MDGATERAIRPIRDDEHESVLAITNDAAQRYRGAISDDRWHDPFSAEYLASPELGSIAPIIGARLFCRRKPPITITTDPTLR